MDENTEKLLLKFKNLKVGIFIDNSNLYHAQKKVGWKIDYKKLKSFFTKCCNLKIYNFYAAVPLKGDPSHVSTHKYLKLIKKTAILKTKPLKYIKEGNKVHKKGDVDLEIAIDVVRSIENLDLILIASGDSDYLELKNWVTKDKKKKIVFMAFKHNMAWEIKYCWHLFFEAIRKEVELKK